MSNNNNHNIQAVQ